MSDCDGCFAITDEAEYVWPDDDYPWGNVHPTWIASDCVNGTCDDFGTGCVQDVECYARNPIKVYVAPTYKAIFYTDLGDGAGWQVRKVVDNLTGTIMIDHEFKAVEVFDCGDRVDGKLIVEDTTGSTVFGPWLFHAECTDCTEV